MIVKTILAGGVADRDGRLKSGDHILQIGDVRPVYNTHFSMENLKSSSHCTLTYCTCQRTEPRCLEENCQWMGREKDQ